MTHSPFFSFSVCSGTRWAWEKAIYLRMVSTFLFLRTASVADLCVYAQYGVRVMQHRESACVCVCVCVLGREGSWVFASTAPVQLVQQYG